MDLEIDTSETEKVSESDRCRHLYTSRPGVCKLTQEHCLACYGAPTRVSYETSNLGDGRRISLIDLLGSDHFLGGEANECPLALVPSRRTYDRYGGRHRAMLKDLTKQFDRQVREILLLRYGQSRINGRNEIVFANSERLPSLFKE